MNCKLCGLEKKLVKAHIIPEFMYKYLYNEDHRFYEVSFPDIMDGKKLNPLVQIGKFDKNILCEGCDNEKLGSLEKYAQKVLFGTTPKSKETPDCKTYKLEGCEFSECKNVNYNKFKLFLLSVLWRSHITDRPTFDSVNLGPHANKIKAMIWNNDAGEELKYPIVTMSFTRADYDYKDLILKPRRIKIKDGINLYIFSISSFQFHFYVNSDDHKLPELVNKMTLKKDNSMRVIHLKGGMEEMLIKKLIK